MNEFKNNILAFVEICAQKGTRHAIISPGSRSAPLTLAFLRHSEIQCRMVVDERAAAFVALGMAQQTRTPVALVCTSGTATLNYAPAVAEAFYQQVPLLVLTADRPPEWIGQNDNQTINQTQLFLQHCRVTFELPVDDGHPDTAWFVQRLASDAINRAQWPVAGPVHLNVPLREPLYPTNELKFDRQIKSIRLAAPEMHLDDKTSEQLASEWNGASSKLVVAGMHRPVMGLAATLQEVEEQTGAVVLADVVSNCHPGQSIQHFDMIFESGEANQDLQPELLVSFGGAVVSKSLKSFLRKHKPKSHWHLQPQPDAIDPFQTLTQILPVSPAYLFGSFLHSESVTLNPNDYFLQTWKEKETQAVEQLQLFFRQSPFSELHAMQTLLQGLPVNSNLQLGNSSIVRLASFVSMSNRPDLEVYSNRGTSGIDGTVSTAVGAALANERLTTLVVGDLAFFYDRNGLWQTDLPPNLRIVIFNNRGGGIFRVLEGARSLPEMEANFVVTNNLTARNTAKDHNLEYVLCKSRVDFDKALPGFFSPKARPAVLEVMFDPAENAQTFLKFKSMIREMT